MSTTTWAESLKPVNPRHGLLVSTRMFECRVGGPGSVPVRFAVFARTERGARLYAHAWARKNWYRDARELNASAEWRGE